MSVTGPNFDVVQGEDRTVTLTRTTTQQAGDAVLLKVGRRMVGTQYSTVASATGTAGPTTVTVTIPTAALTGLEYLWQVELRSAAGAVRERWRGALLVVGRCL